MRNYLDEPAMSERTGNGGMHIKLENNKGKKVLINAQTKENEGRERKRKEERAA